jgi:hypothetical protein
MRFIFLPGSFFSLFTTLVNKLSLLSHAYRKIWVEGVAWQYEDFVTAPRKIAIELEG